VLEEAIALYDGEVRAADHGVGLLLEALDGRGLASNTVVAFTADHGECFDHGILFEHSECLYDGAIRVPLILRAPGRIPAGSRIEEPVEHIDLAPTLLELAGVLAPATFRGRSLLGPRPSDPDRAGFFEMPLYKEGAAAGRARNAAGVRTVAGVPLRPIVDGRHVLGARSKRWKYLLAEDAEELYDLEADPAESTNLASREREIAARWRARLRRWDAANPLQLLRPELVDPETVETLRALGYLG
jgi:arylsulfatase A-like enzyme